MWVYALADEGHTALTAPLDEYSHSVDLVEQFANACRKRGIKFGLYYSVVTNAYLGSVRGKSAKRIESYAARVP